MGTQDIHVPGWAKFILSILIPLATGLIGYGELRGRMDAVETRLNDKTQAADVRLTEKTRNLEERIERIERDAAERNSKTEKNMEVVRDAIGGVQIDIARICTRLRCSGK